MKIRSAVPTDAVALYKQIVHEEQKSGTHREADVGARIAHILHVIMTGCVVVVEGNSGRIFASIGLSSSNPGYLLRNSLNSEWYFAAAVLQGTNAVQAMVKKIVGFARLHSVGINAILPLHATELRTLLQDYGFTPVAQAYALKPKEPDEDEREDPPPASVHPISQPAGATKTQPGKSAVGGPSDRPAAVPESVPERPDAEAGPATDPLEPQDD